MKERSEKEYDGQRSLGIKSAGISQGRELQGQGWLWSQAQPQEDSRGAAGPRHPNQCSSSMSHKPPPNLAVHPVLLNHWTSPDLLSYHLSNQSYDGFIWKQTELISCLIINVVLHSKHKINLKNMYKAVRSRQKSSVLWLELDPKTRRTQIVE